MDFEWDHNKNRLNIEKHGIDFEDARRIFEGLFWEIPSHQGWHDEDRVLAIGILDGREIVVVYTWRERNRRIISARRARRYERKTYWKAIKG